MESADVHHIPTDLRRQRRGFPARWRVDVSANRGWLAANSAKAAAASLASLSPIAYVTSTWTAQASEAAPSLGSGFAEQGVP